VLSAASDAKSNLTTRYSQTISGVRDAERFVQPVKCSGFTCRLQRNIRQFYTDDKALSGVAKIY
jgi:hypothetical protein